MKQYLISFFITILLFSNSSKAQLNHFIYLQTENKQPFYVKFDKKVISSSAAGYLIIPKLQKGVYALKIGFPKNEWNEQNFSCTIKNDDVGFLVKNFGEKGWGLFNLQTMDVAMTGESIKPAVLVNMDKTDEFSNLLSTVVNDPSILKKDTEKQVLIKKEIVPENSVIESKDTIIDARSQAAVRVHNNNKPSNTKQKSIAVIQKISTSTTKEGLSILYIDPNNNKLDTIVVFIPFDTITTSVTIAKDLELINLPESNLDKNEMNPSGKQIFVDSMVKSKPIKAADGQLLAAIKNPSQVIEEKINEPVVSTTTVTPTFKEKPTAQKFLPIEMSSTESVQNSNKDSIIKNAISSANSNQSNPIQKTTRIITNSDCIINATEEDFLRLRKKMASAKDDDEMLNIARKTFKTKCFSTDQVKNLGVLFLKDAAKYSFFDLSYSFVWDSNNFPLLEDQLNDPYYKDRFKVMVHH